MHFDVRGVHQELLRWLCQSNLANQVPLKRPIEELSMTH
ncbi:hypothetical protein C8D95_11543 [Silicimonas algicola]|uniref:Uncharacterized protein n=1 Tax=Silicimonas algicola TaxID=1826607 RepID=A0A316FYI9_9RHOB|nr:hypothetical protein C8D95_11543 [Silicimonas algicola]